ncbi:NAD(P)H-hydrate dehydratase [Kamptonema animale CS-326]|jgi:hydroxyethylthiazole kinase-like uncharacterized protein yjeF|uniref:NAD(P)H-hydrate dehydratase n=1 Tax=Kamptonema animale TaxID=92934 RepID=UPI00232D4105|nr:NAD(P)H-hydrate dehydratase [Kamptonema animale]MDB9515053.1 NAD(P)H-hydrate dehydratase [Kamptonema animale CS-326]
MANNIDQFVVTAEQMREIEGRIFAAGMPVAALMEKVAGLISRRIQEVWKSRAKNIAPFSLPIIGVLVGPGHNGGDALVVARELYFQGYQVIIYCPFDKLKDLTSFHAQYVRSLNIPYFENIESLTKCDLLIDGLFGFGLEREIINPFAAAIEEINSWKKTVFSIDIPSGLHTDTGAVLGTAIRATNTFCLGLWKLAFLQDKALEYIGKAELIDFDIPIADITAVLGESLAVKRIVKASAIAHLPLPRRPDSHKYTNGHLLIVAGSRRYSGAAILAALGARASGVGMLSIAVPESLKLLVAAQLPEALVIGCPETTDGAIRELPVGLDFATYDAIAVGPGLTSEAALIVKSILESDRPLILDADGLNILAQFGTIPTLSTRKAPTALSPHPGEFKRLFPDLADKMGDRVTVTQQAAQLSGAVVLLKGARVCISWKDAIGNLSTLINPQSTPALARGGSGDVLTGLLAGLWAQAAAKDEPVESVVETAVWWHAQAGILAAIERTELGVDAFTLTQYLIPALHYEIKD